MTPARLREDLRRDFATRGYCILQHRALRQRAADLGARFQRDFASRFTGDPGRNRNLIKRFGDSLDAARFFADPELAAALSGIGVGDPVYCGPVVTHYTSHDLTGQSYGLPFHQDWRSMASSDNAAILWTSLTESGPETHGLEVVPAAHRSGLLHWTDQRADPPPDIPRDLESLVLSVHPGDVVIMSPFLPHRTYVDPQFSGWKLSLSRRIDDLTCPVWPERGFANAYGTSVDRDLYKSSRQSAPARRAGRR